MLSLTCDQCRFRKIKCDGDSPCFRCQKSKLECSRKLGHRRRGPKQGSGRVVSRLRNEQSKASTTNDFPSTRIEFERPPESLLELNVEGERLEAHGMTKVRASLQSPVSLPDSRDPGSESRTIITTERDTSETVPGLVRAASFHEHVHEKPHDGRHPLLVPRTINVTDLSASPASISRWVDLHAPQGLSTQSSPASGSIFSCSSFCDKPLTPMLPTSHPVFTEAPSLENNALYLKGSQSALDEPAFVTLTERTGLPAILFSQCVKQFFCHLHASYPVLQETSFIPLLQEPLHNKEYEFLLLSLCAFTVLRAPPSLFIGGTSPSNLAKRMISSCQTLRTAYDWVEKATLVTVIGSYFLCMAYYDLEQKRSYEYYLREAIQLAYADDLRLDAGGVQPNSDVGKVLHERILVLLYITNRSGGVQRHRAVSQLARAPIPSLCLDPGDDLKLRGLESLTQLFDLVNDDFMDTWLSSSCESAADETRSSQPLSNKRIIDQLSFDTSNMTVTQQPDLLVTLRWLRLAYWQISMKKGLVSSFATDETLSYRYPMEIAQGLCEILRSLPVEVVFRHGRCIIEKIFDITYALIDCLAIARIPHNESPALVYLLNYLSYAPRIHHGFSGVLQKHMEGYRATTASI